MRGIASPFFLSILLVSVFGAGIVDILFTDVIPLRPYDAMLRWVPQFASSSGRATLADPGSALAVLLLLVAISITVLLHWNGLIVIPLTGRARIHSSHPHTAGRHKDYAPLRNRTLATQINIPLEQYAKQKREEFEKQYPTKPKVVGQESLWQD